MFRRYSGVPRPSQRTASQLARSVSEGEERSSNLQRMGSSSSTLKQQHLASIEEAVSGQIDQQLMEDRRRRSRFIHVLLCGTDGNAKISFLEAINRSFELMPLKDYFPMNDSDDPIIRIRQGSMVHRFIVSGMKQIVERFLQTEEGKKLEALMDETHSYNEEDLNLLECMKELGCWKPTTYLDAEAGEVLQVIWKHPGIEQFIHTIRHSNTLKQGEDLWLSWLAHFISELDSRIAIFDYAPTFGDKLRVLYHHKKPIHFAVKISDVAFQVIDFNQSFYQDSMRSDPKDLMRWVSYCEPFEGAVYVLSLDSFFQLPSNTPAISLEAEMIRFQRLLKMNEMFYTEITLVITGCENFEQRLKHAQLVTMIEHSINFDFRREAQRKDSFASLQETTSFPRPDVNTVKNKIEQLFFSDEVYRSQRACHFLDSTAMATGDNSLFPIIFGILRHEIGHMFAW